MARCLFSVIVDGSAVLHLCCTLLLAGHYLLSELQTQNLGAYVIRLTYVVIDVGCNQQVQERLVNTVIYDRLLM